MTTVRKTEAGIRVQELTAAYDRHPVLNEVDLTVSAGEMVGVIGPNGSGKSTMLKVIGRLLAPEHGVVYLDGECMSDLSTGQIARKLATLPQAPPTPPELTVRELVGYGRYPHVSWLKRFAAHDRDIIERTISKCNLEDLADRKLATLSGGERQKAWIAMAMAQQPQVMLLDEPVTFPGHQSPVGGDGPCRGTQSHRGHYRNCRASRPESSRPLLSPADRDEGRQNSLGWDCQRGDCTGCVEGGIRDRSARCRGPSHPEAGMLSVSTELTTG